MAGGLTDIVAVNCNGKVQFFSILFCLRYTIKLLINKQTFTSNLVLCTTLVLLELGSVLPGWGGDIGCLRTRSSEGSGAAQACDDALHFSTAVKVSENLLLAG